MVFYHHFSYNHQNESYDINLSIQYIMFKGFWHIFLHMYPRNIHKNLHKALRLKWASCQKYG